MTDEKHAREEVEALIQRFKELVVQSNAIRQQMKELARRIESHTGHSMGLNSSHEIDVPDVPESD